MDLGPLAVNGIDADLAVVHVQDLPGNGKTQAGAAGLTGAGFVHPVEPFKQVGQVLFRDADAVVRNGDVQLLLLPSLQFHPKQHLCYACGKS